MFAQTVGRADKWAEVQTGVEDGVFGQRPATAGFFPIAHVKGYTNMEKQSADGVFGSIVTCQVQRVRHVIPIVVGVLKIGREFAVTPIGICRGVVFPIVGMLTETVLGIVPVVHYHSESGGHATGDSFAGTGTFAIVGLTLPPVHAAQKLPYLVVVEIAFG